MNRSVYQQRRTYMKYDAGHIIGYLNEEVVKNFIPEAGNRGEGEQEKPEPWPEAYAYTGTETDGGIVMACEDISRHGAIADAIIRSRYSVSEEMAIQRHAINGDYEESSEEYEQYDAWCRYAVETAKSWIAAGKE